MMFAKPFLKGGGLRAPRWLLQKARPQLMSSASQDALHATEERTPERYLSIVENAIEGIFQSTPSGHYLHVNPALARLYGYDSSAELIENLQNIAKDLYVDPNRRSDFQRLLKAQGYVSDFEAEVYRKDGSKIWIMENARIVCDPEGKPLYYEGSVIDITNRKRVEAALLESEARYRSVVNSVKDVIFTMDAEGRWTFLNLAMQEVLGYDPEACLGKSFLEYLAEEERGRYQAQFEAVARRDRAFFRHESRFLTQSGDIKWLETRAQCSQDSEGAITGFFGTLSDITERKVAEDRLFHQALHDALTGLPNRLLFQDRLGEALARAKRHASGIAVLFVDLDNFKVINDSMGHGAGDELLKTIAHRLRLAAREEDTIARLGGDEFILLLERLDTVEGAQCVAERIVEEIQRPVTLGDREVFVTASIGIAFAEEGYHDSERLLRDADTAMYQAKARDKAGYVVFDSGMNADLMERLELETGLRGAVERNELRLHYQPLIDLETGTMCGVEALLRWENPKYGLMMPGKFIEIAEETGLIVPLGYWALEEACRQMKAWMSDANTPSDMTVNVNLSGKQLLRPDVVDRVRDVLNKTGLPPQRLKLEITESVMMRDFETTLGKLKLLKEQGVKLAMDDFGTGYSSIASLSLFPLDTVKIDRAFVKRLAEHEEANSVIAAIVMLSQALSLDVTGEGIETEEQRETLRRLGCHVGQGYLFAKPLPSVLLQQHAFFRQTDTECETQNRAA